MGIIHTRVVSVIMAAAAALLALAVRSVGSSTPNADPIPIRIEMAKLCFRNVNLNDATAAYRTFVEESGRRQGKTYRVDVRVFDEVAAFEATLHQGPVQMAVLEAWQYLTTDFRGRMKPYFSIRENGRVGRRYRIYTRRDGGLDTLASLRGQPLLRSELGNANGANVWLESLLLPTAGMGPNSFFGRQQIFAKPTAAVLPVFFRKNPACLVDETAFDLIAELNPQVGQQLQAIASSESLADVIICLSTRDWVSEQELADTIGTLQEAHLSPVGQQMCTLFKIDRMVPFEERQLDTLRHLRTEVDRLRAALPPVPAESPNPHPSASAPPAPRP